MSEKCKSCGAEIEYAAGSQSLVCQYCGASNEIQKAENQRPAAVEKIIPMTVSQDDLEKCVYAYMATGAYTPDDMLEAATFIKKERFYVPAFGFGVTYEATWTASFGYDRKEAYTDYRTVTRNNRQHQEAYTAYRTVTDWRPANGVDSGTFVVSTYAGKKLGESNLTPAELVPNVIAQGRITDFNPSFAKGVETEKFSVSEASAFASLKSEINANINQRVEKHGQGNHQKDWHWNAKMSHITNTLAVPICHAVFDYEGKEYHVWIDGIGESGLRADKLPEDKGRKKTVYLGFLPAGFAIATLISSALKGTFTPVEVMAAAVFVWYAVARRKSILGYSTKIRDSLLTQIHASSNAVKNMNSVEQDKAARSFERPKKPRLAKTHYDKFVLPVLSVLAIFLVNASNKDSLAEAANEKALAAQRVATPAPAPIAVPVTTLPVVVQPDSASAVTAGITVATNQANDAEREALCNGLDMGVDSQLLECLNRKFASADNQLNEIYKQLMAGLDDARKLSLKNEQITWIKERETKCTQAGKQYEGGTVQPMVIEDCNVQMTEERVEFLRKYK